MATTLTAPTGTLGRVSSMSFGQILDELTVDLPPDLMWPLSIWTYSTMRREAHLSAILSGYMLQLRRAQWQINPAGCRPEVVQLVADDLGLPIAGLDKPTASRTRGVSWNEHLRSALMCLTYGHFGFEMQADVSSGQARLVGLWERPPWSIHQIFADPVSGRFDGVSQPQAGKITADRLVWYCREREGTNWAGSSLLRAAFPQWLIKREMLRVHATANRRFGMGVPVVEELPGANVTAPQHAAAAAFAQAAAVGESSGGALPPGFTLKLVGLTGSAPDTLGFLRFLNEEMSRSVMMQHIDLGTSATGSRALGEAFLDNWFLALEALAQEMADTATRQIAARLVAWNWGPDEPVPQVVVSGVGSQREVTAQSLQYLMSAGALSADPALESWVRREWRLPEREQVDPPPMAVAGVDIPKDTTTPAAAATSGKPQARLTRPKLRAANHRTPTGQLRLFAAADTTMTELQPQWAQTKADVLAAWPDAAQPVVDDLASQVNDAADRGDIGALASLAVTPAALAAVIALLGDHGLDLATAARDGLLAEAAGAGHNVDADDPEDTVRSTAEVIASVVAASYAASAARAGLLAFGDGAADAVRATLTAIGAAATGLVADNVGGLLSAAQNAGRDCVLKVAEMAGLISGYRAVEINDTNRCEPCATVDGTQYDTLVQARADYPTAGYHECAGQLRCRGGIAPTWK